MKKSIYLGFAFLTIMLIFNGCSKDNTGIQGRAGINGNANVSGDTITVSSWINGMYMWYFNLSIPAITQNIIDKGLVMVYIEYPQQWVPLPDFNGINSTTFSIALGQIKLLNSNTDNTLPANPGAKLFRYVIIPASTLKAHPNINWKNYVDAQKVLNPDIEY